MSVQRHIFSLFTPCFLKQLLFISIIIIIKIIESINIIIIIIIIIVFVDLIVIFKYLNASSVFTN